MTAIQTNSVYIGETEPGLALLSLHHLLEVQFVSSEGEALLSSLGEKL